MIKNQEEDEFVAVRVQDPRVQNEGSWNSYVDFKIFLHTNSKAFTAKTSCVRRRFSEFVWLKKRMQKNTGLVPVPDLPRKSFFSFSNEDFIESRRKGLQSFLDKVCSMTVCLSDSQLHLFLQTQLPVGHILDCVQGHTPYTVTEAILTYASSNRGWVQEEDSAQEPSLSPVPYESMESPTPHLPSLQRKEPVDPAWVASGGLEVVRTETFLAAVRYIDTVGLLLCEGETPLPEVPRKNHNVFPLEAVLEIHSPVEAICKCEETTRERLECNGEIHRQGDCQRQASPDVHCEKDLELKTERVSSLITEAVPPDQSSLDRCEEVIHQGDRQHHPLGTGHHEGATVPGEGTPAETISEVAPEVEIPEVAPEVEIPEVAPEVEIPEVAPEVEIPEVAPEVEIPEVAPEVEIPEVAPEGGHSVRGSIPEDLRLGEETQEIPRHKETMSKTDNNVGADLAIWTDSRGHREQIKCHIEVRLEEECCEVTTQEGKALMT